MKKNIHIWLIIKLLIISLALFNACETKKGNDKTTTDEPKEQPLVLKPAPKFSGDTAYRYVKAQVDFGPRVPNTEAHRRCADYLKNTLQSLGWQVIVQDFDATAYNGKILKSKNIIGVYNPQAPTRILLAAHWDTRPYNDKEVSDTTKYEPIDGANDGASGVGVLLEIARAIYQSEKKPEVGIDIIFFDSEDYGQPEDYAGQYQPDMWCLGSQYWSKNKHKADYQAYFGILLDMVGAKGAQFYREGTSMEKAGDVTNMVWKVAQQLNYGQYFKMLNSPGITDDHTYVNQIAKIPMLDIIEYDPNNKDSFFGHYHHTKKDNMSIIDSKTLEAVGQTVLQVVYNQTVQ
ncbi:MAG: M28 family peptidase [Microscillaceae bacterium]|jgi:Zn-dependent M28 family amino/carboxypeptidase|nr:M28 family peptidase [Microscillaceae bacterium]